MSRSETGETSGAAVDVDSDRRLQERTWLFSRIGWLVMLLLIAAATLGLTGSGGSLSRHQLHAGAAEVDVPRIARWASADHMKIDFGPEARGAVEVTVPKAFLETFTIESVSPQPSSVVATPAGHTFAFEFSDEPGERSAQFAIRAGSPSLPTNAGRFEVDGARAPDASIIVLP